MSSRTLRVVPRPAPAIVDADNRQPDRGRGFGDQEFGDARRCARRGDRLVVYSASGQRHLDPLGIVGGEFDADVAVCARPAGRHAADQQRRPGRHSLHPLQRPLRAARAATERGRRRRTAPGTRTAPARSPRSTATASSPEAAADGPPCVWRGPSRRARVRRSAGRRPARSARDPAGCARRRTRDLSAGPVRDRVRSDPSRRSCAIRRSARGCPCRVARPPGGAHAVVAAAGRKLGQEDTRSACRLRRAGPSRR